jgi:prepilin-type N-terminal cleavage/methylation domain-containing protein
MNTVMSRMRRIADDDGGFTLVELVITIFMLGVVVAPLTAIVILQLKNTDATAARLSESHDAQLVASYLAQDVQAVGVRGAYSSTAEPPFIPSIETSAPAAAGTYPCGAAGTPDAVVRLAWDDYTAAPAVSRAQKRVAYVVEGSELHRITCDGSGAVSADLTIAHDLVAPFVSVSCANAAVVAMSCTGTTLPATVSLDLTIQDPDSGSDSPYEVTLTGQRRQT